MEAYLNKKLSPREAMELAVEQAKKAHGFVLPNPPVACVILDSHYKFLSSGFYSHYGGLHAEVQALNKIKNKKLLQGAHLFVTLEPCAHFGQNPPCLDQILKYPFASVTYGTEDPNPKTKGISLKKLQQQGILVKKSPFCKNDIQKLYEAFVKNMESQQAFFAIKVASSLDGVIALNHGESQWITSQTSRNLLPDLRACFDAVLIGIGTFLQDDPRLNIRSKAYKDYHNKACILDPEGRCLNLLSKSQLMKVRPAKNIFVITQSSHFKKSVPVQQIHADFIPNTKHFDLHKLSKQLYQEVGISSVLIEGGASVFSHFLQQNQVQRLYQFINPSLIGQHFGKSWTQSLSINSLKNKKQLQNVELIACGKDYLITGTF